MVFSDNIQLAYFRRDDKLSITYLLTESKKRSTLGQSLELPGVGSLPVEGAPAPQGAHSEQSSSLIVSLINCDIDM